MKNCFTVDTVDGNSGSTVAGDNLEIIYLIEQRYII